MYEFDWSSIPGALPYLWQGMVRTLQITGVAIVVGIVLGTLIALMRLSKNSILSNLAAFYVNGFRSIPLVMVLTLVLPAGSPVYQQFDWPAFD